MEGVKEEDGGGAKLFLECVIMSCLVFFLFMCVVMACLCVSQCVSFRNMYVCVLKSIYVSILF